MTPAQSKAKTTIGQKVRSLRKNAYLSQLKLEAAIDAAPGSISRIENGKVNPSKETLHAIAQALKLSTRQKVELFDITTQLPTEVEIEKAKEECSSYLQNDNRYAYLLDEWGNIFAASPKMLSAINITPSQAEKIWGKNLLELLLSPDLFVRNAIDPDYFEKVITMEIKRAVVEMQMEELESFQETLKNPEFKHFYEASKTLPDEIVFSPLAKQTFLVVNGQKLKFNLSRENLKRNPRFRIIELFNPQPYE